MEMKEIGGYLEIDQYELPMLHEGALALNCGRNCLAYLIKAHHIKNIVLPKLLCDCVHDVCKRERVRVRHYSVNTDFLPEDIYLNSDEWLYVVNYYSQLGQETLEQIIKRYKHVIIDNSHAYFQMPIKGVDTLYTCRKFLGVADGAFLYTDMMHQSDMVRDISCQRTQFLFGRYEQSASEYYKDFLNNEDFFSREPVKRMSRLTENMLHAVNYDKIRDIRTANFLYLHDRLKTYNCLKLSVPSGAYMYPLYISDGYKIREELKKEKIYIPILWPNVLKECGPDELEYDMAYNILPLPVDQRYNSSEMDFIIKKIERLL